MCIGIVGTSNPGEFLSITIYRNLILTYKNFYCIHIECNGISNNGIIGIQLYLNSDASEFLIYWNSDILEFLLCHLPVYGNYQNITITSTSQFQGIGIPTYYNFDVLKFPTYQNHENS